MFAAVATLPLSASAQDQKAAAPTPRQCEEYGNRDHIVGALFETDGSINTLGLRYHLANTSGDDCRGGSLTWFAYGLDVRAPAFDALSPYASARLGVMGDASGGGLEAGIGPTTDFDRTAAASYLGIFMLGYFFELGAIYQFPIGTDRPHWLAGWQFAVHLNVPVVSSTRYRRVARPEIQ